MARTRASVAAAEVQRQAAAVDPKQTAKGSRPNARAKAAKAVKAEAPDTLSQPSLAAQAVKLEPEIKQGPKARTARQPAVKAEPAESAVKEEPDQDVKPAKRRRNAAAAAAPEHKPVRPLTCSSRALRQRAACEQLAVSQSQVSSWQAPVVPTRLDKCARALWPISDRGQLVHTCWQQWQLQCSASEQAPTKPHDRHLPMRRPQRPRGARRPRSSRRMTQPTSCCRMLWRWQHRPKSLVCCSSVTVAVTSLAWHDQAVLWARLPAASQRGSQETLCRLPRRHGRRHRACSRECSLRRSAFAWCLPWRS